MISAITVIKTENPSKVCKEYKLSATGEVEKKAIANITEGLAFCMDVSDAQKMVSLLMNVTSRQDLVLMSGQFHNDPGKKFKIIPEVKLAELLGSQIGQVQGGVVEHDGMYVAARVKRGINPSAWVLLDADNPPGMPAEWAAMSIGERLVLWDQLLPGISQCERIEMKGSSARVVNGSGRHKTSHAWLRVSDPSKISLMKAYLSIEMVVKGLSFKFKKQSKLEPGKVAGIESRSLFDLAVFDTGRLVFCAQPDIQVPGYTLDDADIEIINPGAGVLDIDWIKRPVESIAKYKEITGVSMDISLSEDGYVAVRNSGQLELHTEICSKGIVKPLSEWIVGLKPGDKIRCESPFRESASEAAFIRLGEDGDPFVYDVGNGTTYNLKKMVSMEIKKQETIEMVDWICDKKGRVEPTQDNLFKLLSQYDLRFDDFRAAYMITVDGKVRNLKETDYTLIQYQAEKLGFKRLSTAMVRENVLFTAQANVFDSAIDWGNGLEWDGVPRCEQLLSKYFGAEESEFTRAASLYIASAMGGRLMSPGCKADAAIVLVGAQGAGKTVSIQALAPMDETFVEINLATRDADQSRQLRGKLIGELGELRGLRSREAEDIKSWMSRTSEEWIPKYQEFSATFKRRLVFWGSTNEQQFLNDVTGNRRWIPIKVVIPKPDLIKQDRDQIWAEAIQIYRKNGVMWRGVQALLAGVHQDFFDEDPLVEKVSEVLVRENNVTRFASSDLWDLLKTGQEFDRKAAHRLKLVMVLLGWSYGKYWKDGKSRNGFEKPSSNEVEGLQ
jgi:hypothetical protein